MQDAAAIRRAVELELRRMQVLGTSTRAPREPHARTLMPAHMVDRWAASRVRVLRRLNQRERTEGRVCRGCGWLFPVTDRRVHRCASCRGERA